MSTLFEQAVTRMQQHMNQFAPLTEEEWNALIPHTSITTFKKHQYIIQQAVLPIKSAL